MTSLMKQLVPRWIKRKVKSIRERRLKAKLFGELAPMVPPVTLMFDGLQSLEAFKLDGEDSVRLYTEICGLRPDEKILEIGSGIGRMTIHLTQFLNKRAEYVGVEIVREGVDWCKKTISERYPNFRFELIDVYNQHYNPGGGTKASEYRFSFPDESFGFIVLGSVFTHMLPVDVRHYLAEIKRLLIPGGRCWISYFLLTDESKRLIEAGKSTLDFRFEGEGYRTISRETPELAIAFEENWVRALYDQVGLQIRHSYYGSWCGREHYLRYQDPILAFKE